jgi:hypothetical protein
MVELKYPVIVDRNIIDQVVEETLERLDTQIAECEKIEEDFAKPLDILGDLKSGKSKDEIFDERLTGRLSTQNLINATAMKNHLLHQKTRLQNFMYNYNR